MESDQKGKKQNQLNIELTEEIAQGIGLATDDIELYGKYKAKISLDVMKRLKDKEVNHSDNEN